jgi:hypothetical protein
VEVGSIAELLSAFASLAALVAAGIAARAAIRTNEQQGRQLEYIEESNLQRDRESERAQAAGLAVWIQLDHDAIARIWSVNAGGLPVYRATVYVATPSGVSETHYSVGNPQPEPGLLSRASDKLDADISVPDGFWLHWLESDLIHAAVTFRDASNHWWLRDFRGRLSRHDDEQSAKRAMNASLDEVIPVDRRSF